MLSSRLLTPRKGIVLSYPVHDDHIFVFFCIFTWGFPVSLHRSIYYHTDRRRQYVYLHLFYPRFTCFSVGRTLPYDGIHTQRPTASLVSRKVLSSILGQIVITSATQAWAFFWVRVQPWYEAPPPPIPGEGIEMHNFENTVLFLVSCFQYILVAAVFSIGPPYRKPMWTNGTLLLYS